ncbi:MAG: AAA family ATPase [Thermoanaerobaculia bacterium]|nr:AAA family ATPase [Thermoanaerobaculia bacterium]
MYIDRLKLENFRTFECADVAFVHPDQDFETLGLPRPRLANINLLLGNNGFGKTALLKAIALAALGPAVRSSGIFPYRLIRREPAGSKVRKSSSEPAEARLDAEFTLHEQDELLEGSKIESHVRVVRKGDLEELEWASPDEEPWHPIYSASSDAFFFVGYGATRRVEQRERIDLGSRRSSVFARAQRVQSLFEEAYSLVPLNAWLPEYKNRNKGRHIQVVNFIDRLTGPEHFSFTGEMEAGEYVFERGGMQVPFRALSDGYRAYLGWIGDLLYHVCMTTPKGKKLVENKGIVMIDEIDLHLHPRWQMTVLSTLAEKLPNIQFIVTSHSPLVVGSLQWMNILLMEPGANQSSRPRRLESPVHGLDADQVLLSEFFGLETTRSDEKGRRLKELTLRARDGDAAAAQLLLEELSRGTEITG